MEILKLSRRPLFDPILRLLHAWNGFFIVALLLTRAAADLLWLEGSVVGLWRLHVWLGYGLLLGMVGRVVWGLVGPERARWRVLWQPNLWRPARLNTRFWTLAAVDNKAVDNKAVNAPPPLAALVYLISYVVLLVSVLSGLALVAIEFDSGPLRAVLGLAFVWSEPARTLHVIGEVWLYLFLIGHFAAMIWQERRDGVPVAQGMISGYCYQREAEDES